jgi:enhancing lycopene biosynthesis protein 2
VGGEEKNMSVIGVLLSGCGKNDGSEIHEATLTLLFLDRACATIVCMAPDVDQYDVINHLTGSPSGEKRNVLVESARIARGDIKAVDDVQESDLDGLIIPGGFGAVKNLSDFAIKGEDATVQPDVHRLLNDMIAAKKPVGAICIAPATLAKAVSGKHPEVTIGNDTGVAGQIESMGGRHTECPVDMICVDEKNRIVTTPAYMLGPGIKDVAEGIEKLVNQVMAWAGSY